MIKFIVCSDYQFSGIANVTSFIGGTDEFGTWVWVDASHFEYMNWRPGQPNGGDKENCLLLSTNLNGTWADIACNATRSETGVICSKDSCEKIHLLSENILTG